MSHDYQDRGRRRRRWEQDDYEIDERDWPAGASHSSLGIASFVIGLLSIIMALAMTLVIASTANQMPRSSASPLEVLHGLCSCGATLLVGAMLGFGAGLLRLVGAGLGVGSVCQTARNKVFGIIGLCLNGMILIGLLAVCLLSLGI